MKKIGEIVKTCRLNRSFVPLLLFLGLLFRLAHYLANRSLWLDEAALALNILERGYPELLQPLSYNQAAPVLFLLALKLLTSLCGAGESIFRLLPFLAGAGALLLFYPLARRAISPGAAPLALALLVFSDRAIYYSGETKQYSLDLFFTVLLLLLADCAYRGGYRVKDLFWLGAAGILAVWCSHPVVFILGGVGGALFLTACREKQTDRKTPVSLAVLGAVWVASFMVNYAFFSGPATRNQAFFDFFADDFAFFIPGSLGELAWYPRTFVEISCNPMGFSIPHAGMVLLAMLAGVIVFWSNKKNFSLIIICLPLVLLLVASAAGAYPLADRLLLFTLPLFYLLIAEGAYFVWQELSRRHLFIGAAFVAILLSIMAGRAFYHLYRPRLINQTGPVIEYCLARRAEGEPLYVLAGSRMVFNYYTFGKEIPHYLGEDTLGNPEAFFADLENFLGAGRSWFLFSHDFYDEEALFLRYIETRAENIAVFKDYQASIYLYELRP